jgi:Toprim-like/Protein of unknown function (DUF3991)
MSNAFQKARADCLRAIPLEAVLQQWGARRDRSDPHKWHTSQGTLSVNGPKFINWTQGVGGGGAIDLALHLNQRGLGQALLWLEDHFPQPTLPQTPLPGTPAPLHLPAPCPGHLAQVHQYLVRVRRLPAALIEQLIQAGSLYADVHANAVFLLRDPQQRAVGAELRGTTRRPWHGLTPGSRKDQGYFSWPDAPQPVCILCESAIDALSCWFLHPHALCVSTAGARSNPPWLPRLLQPGASVYCGYDADATGEIMAQVMLSRYPTLRRLRPPCKDWNDALRAWPE